ncbi:hypothetical protein AMAG_04821 [Allomyces macrogynus ATCC 38327]|uniref:SWIM-type domain-containing protein n=1 Tax=Allomyces macrogynus (strain ATCC 38327) TaxID=578462 RepID=A0A0L0S6H7_ALLM3|nr:hypothetical protein AMAG_04821 [Allomyces macrogynus ATCC 38327]|eukprot:KNE57991.1 hypothetical protein AMAG_04821 [Allomyces macrogynus ATCC 38327]
MARASGSFPERCPRAARASRGEGGATDVGYATASSLTKAVTLLVVADESVAGQKVEKARAQGVRVITEAEWDSMLANGGTAAAGDAEEEEEDEPRMEMDPEEDEDEQMADAENETSGTSTGVQPGPHVVCFSGKLPSGATRKVAEAAAIAGGHQVSSTITKKTTIVVADRESAGGKLEKADEMGIPIVSEAEWTAFLQGDAPAASVAPAAAAPAAAKGNGKAATSILVNQTLSADDVADLTASRLDDDETGAINGVTPLRVLADGETVEIGSQSSSSKYKCKRTGDHYSCSCPAWRIQKTPVDARTCKHLKQLLGDAYEAARCNLTGDAAAPAATKSTRARKAPAKPTAKFDVLLAQKWEPTQDPTGWWMSEKLDGVRAYWCPTQRQLISRLGNAFSAPDWFIDALPTDMSLDGELFCGRQMFQSTVSIVRTHNSEKWNMVKYQVFDAPSLSEHGFEARLKAIEEYVARTGKVHVQAVPHTQCTGEAHLMETLAAVEAAGGEGIMCREPKSKYVMGRSKTLLKVKTFADGEARVTGHDIATRGKHKGKLGALLCEMASGKAFKVGTGFSDAQRELDAAPAIGTLIKYKCQELTRDKVPRFPVYLGVAEPDRTEPSDPVFAATATEDVDV